MDKLESVLENETYKIPMNFKPQRHHLIPSRSAEQVFIYKKTELTI